MLGLLAFIDLTDPNVRWVFLGTMLIGLSSAVAGCFMVLNKKSLVGDAISHAVLPGVALAFILFNTRNPLILLAGAALTGWLSIVTIEWIIEESRIKSDAAIGLVLSVFFGVGILLFTSIQRSGNANQAGLDKFLFGNAASLIGADLWTALGVSIFVLTTAALFFKQFQIYSFDPLYAEAIGLPVKGIRFLLSFITVLVVTVGIQIVGVVLMSALLITPAVAGRYWTDDLKSMIGLASIFSVVSCIGGVLVSYLFAKMPTGPWIVVILSFCAVASIIFAPKRGFLFRWIENRRHQQKIKNENVIKVLYHLGEGAGDFDHFWDTASIQNRKRLDPEILRSSIAQLRKQELVDQDGQSWKLSKAGLEEGKRIVRLHRLWELYLTKHLAIGSDNVHQNAEAIEHIITPEIEKQLAEFLDFPERDPHDKEIPGVKNIEWNS